MNYLGDISLKKLITLIKNEIKNASGGFPPCTPEDEGKFLRVVNGVVTWVSIPSAEEGEF